jgi:uncharacterized protein
MRVVLDTNVLLVAIPRLSKYRIIFDAFLSKRFEIAISNEILEEYFEIISAKANPVVGANIVDQLLSSTNCLRQNVFYKWNLIKFDQDDNKFVDCAIASSSDFLITNDQHFKELAKISFPKIEVLNIEEFMILLNEID